MIGASARPASVSSINRFPRLTKIATPSSSPSSLICRDTPGWEVRRLCAAAVRLSPCLTAARTYRSCWKFTGHLMLN